MRKSTVILTVLLLIAAGVAVYLFTSTGTLREIRDRLKTENAEIRNEYAVALDLENDYLEVIDTAADDIATLEESEETHAEEMRRLKAEIADVKPENPANFLSLKKCKEKYTDLEKTLKNALNINEEAEISLTLCQEKDNKQKEIIISQERVYLSCKDRVKLLKKENDNFKKALTDLDRGHKKKQFKRAWHKYAIGAVVGIVAGYFAFRRK